MEIVNLAGDAEEFTGNVWRIKNDSGIALVDAGEGDVWQRISEQERVDTVVITHSHHDHVDNLPGIVEEFDPQIYAFEPGNLPVDAEELSDGDEIRLCGEVFKVLHTPGHKDDSICLYAPVKEILFTGDLVFPDGGFGRTDLAEGDRDLLIESIRKVSGLELECFYPGHGEAVTGKAEEWIERSLKEAEKRESKY